MNILTIIILAVILLSAVHGWKKGLVKKLAGIISMLLSCFLVSAALPYITEFIKTETPVYEYIVYQCESVLSGQNMSHWITGEKKSGSVDRAEIKSLMEQYGMDSSMVDSMSDDELNQLIGQYFQGYGSVDTEYGSSDQKLTKIEQTKLIENLPVPEFLKELLINYNNSEGYSKLEVTDFTEYIVRFFANIILNIVATVVTFLIVQLVLWTGITALDLFSRLPLLNFINHIGGLAVGTVQGLCIVWLLFLIIYILSSIGNESVLMNMTQESTLLQPIYENNLFLKMAVQGISNMF